MGGSRWGVVLVVLVIGLVLAVVVVLMVRAGSVFAVGADCPDNYLEDCGFESGNWGAWVYSQDGSFSTAAARTGTYGWKGSKGAGWPDNYYTYQTFTVDRSGQLKIGYWGKHYNGSYNSFIRLDKWNGSSWVQIWNATNLPPWDNNWHYHRTSSVNWASPGDQYRIRLGLGYNYWDDLSVQVDDQGPIVPTPTPGYGQLGGAPCDLRSNYSGTVEAPSPGDLANLLVNPSFEDTEDFFGWEVQGLAGVGEAQCLGACPYGEDYLSIAEGADDTVVGQSVWLPPVGGGYELEYGLAHRSFLGSPGLVEVGVDSEVLSNVTAWREYTGGSSGSLPGGGVGFNLSGGGAAFDSAYLYARSVSSSQLICYDGPTPTAIPATPTPKPYATVAYITHTYVTTGGAESAINPGAPINHGTTCVQLGPYEFDVDQPGGGAITETFGFQLCVEEYEFGVGFLGYNISTALLAYLGVVAVVVGIIKAG